MSDAFAQAVAAIQNLYATSLTANSSAPSKPSSKPHSKQFSRVKPVFKPKRSRKQKSFTKKPSLPVSEAVMMSRDEIIAHAGTISADSSCTNNYKPKSQ